MDRDIERQPLIGPAEEDGRQDQVAGRAHRQKLGDSLNQGEHDDL
jgi:hypothetical protein